MIFFNIILLTLSPCYTDASIAIGVKLILWLIFLNSTVSFGNPAMNSLLASTSCSTSSSTSSLRLRSCFLSYLLYLFRSKFLYSSSNFLDRSMPCLVNYIPRVQLGRRSLFRRVLLIYPMYFFYPQNNTLNLSYKRQL